MIKNGTCFKSSDIKWFGKVPKHWEISKAKFASHIFVPQRNKPELNTEDGIPWLTMEDMRFKRVSNTSCKVSQEASKLAGSKILNKGSVIASCVGNFGVCTINDVDLIINQQLQAFIPCKSIMPEYLRELVSISNSYFQMIAAEVTIVYVNQLGFANMPVLLPPKPEQKKIVDYLDRETTQIDNLIAAKEQMLTLLEEKREALISHAVTRGLDPNVAFKRSGLDWLGDIPQHWQFCQIRRLSPVKRGASPRPIDDLKYFDDDGEFSWVRISDVTASRKYLTQTTEKLSVLGSSLSVKLYPETFFVSIAASVGKPIITKIKCCIHDGFVYFPYLRINNDFLYYLFEGGQLFQGLGKLGTQLNLNTETIGSIHIPIPPDDEIKMIVDFLDRETSRLNELLAAIKESIALLKERRSALITAAVTGQIALEEMTS